jgi:GNAT superfamily N-acetyltransferase
MRGQRLFVRPIDAADAPSVDAFLARHGAAGTAPAWGLVGKLVGELVAVLSLEVTETAIRLNDLVVAEELRRKRVGRVMMNELGVLAAKMGRPRIEAERGRADEFLRRVGFAEEGSKMVRRVGGMNDER